MPILQRYLLREMLANGLLTFGVVTLIFIVGGALRVLHDSDLLTLGVFVELVLLFIGTELGTILPMTVLMAVMFTYGRASAENEINAMRASGIHLAYAFAPGLLFGLAGSALVLHVNDEVAPRMSFQERQFSEQAIASTLESFAARGEQGIEISDHERLLWHTFDPETGVFHKLRIKRYPSDIKKGANAVQDEIYAETGHISFDDRQRLMRVHFEDVKKLHGGGANTSFRRFHIPFPMSIEAREKKVYHYTLSELIEARSRRYDGAPKRTVLVAEFHQRIAGAFACVLFALIAMPLAVIFRQGNRMVAFLIALLVALVVYYPTFILGEVLAKETDLPPILAIWSGSIALFILGVGLNAVVFRR